MDQRGFGSARTAMANGASYVWGRASASSLR